MEKKAQEYLKEHPELEKLYGTSDGFLFEKEQDARSHAKTLANKEVSTFMPQKEVVVKQVNAKQDIPFDYEGEDSRLLEDRAFLLARYEFLAEDTPAEDITTEDLATEVQSLEEMSFDK